MPQLKFYEARVKISGMAQIIVSDTLKYSRRRVLMFKFLGFGPITVDVNWKSKTKPTDVLFFLFPIVFGFSAIYFAIINREKLSSSKSMIADYGNFIMIIASICVTIVSMIFFFIYRHKIWSIILEMVKVEEKV